LLVTANGKVLIDMVRRLAHHGPHLSDATLAAIRKNFLAN
jgi:hypothetical protein